MIYFEVVNYGKFQHYRDRNPLWIKLYQTVLTDYEFTRLPDASKMHLLAIWLLASRYQNKIPWDEKWIAGQISASEKIDLAALERAKFINKINVVQDASNVLASCYHSASPEREIERERETEREKNLLITAPTALPPTAVRTNDHDDFDSWWQGYPAKVGKKAAAAEYRRIIKRGEATAEQLAVGVTRYIASKPAERAWCHPLTWLRQGRWADEGHRSRLEMAQEWLSLIHI